MSYCIFLCKYEIRNFAHLDPGGRAPHPTPPRRFRKSNGRTRLLYLMGVLGYLMGVLGYLMGVLRYLMGVLGCPMAWRRHQAMGYPRTLIGYPRTPIRVEWGGVGWGARPPGSRCAKFLISYLQRKMQELIFASPPARYLISNCCVS